MAAHESPLARDRVVAPGDVAVASRPGLAVRVIEPLHAVSLRHLPGGGEAVAQAAAAIGIAALPGCGQVAGADPFVLWRNPGELMLFSTTPAPAEQALRALAPAAGALSTAVDLTHGVIGFELQGPALAELLPRLLDASAIPHAAGQGTRARLADIAVFVLRLAADRAWLVADRANDRYLADWIAYAGQALAS